MSNAIYSPALRGATTIVGVFEKLHDALDNFGIRVEPIVIVDPTTNRTVGTVYFDTDGYPFFRGSEGEVDLEWL